MTDSRILSTYRSKLRLSTSVGLLLGFVTYVFVIGLIVAGTTRLSHINTELEQTKQELRKTETELAERRAETARLDEQIKDKQTEFEQLKNNVQNFSYSTSLGGAQTNVTLGVKGSELYEIRASAHPAAGGSLYVFSAELNASPDVLSRIEKVDYFFNHPSFRQQHLVGTNPADKFRVSYTGWGCLDQVVVTVYFNDGETRQSDVNMCNYLPDFPHK